MDEIEPKFGEWLRGIYASESNPRRDGMYVRTIIRRGRMNPGKFYEVTDGNGNFWVYPAQSVERIAAALRSAQGPQWQPIETAPRDGTRIMVANAHGAWMAEWRQVYVSGYQPENPWFSAMLNKDHIAREHRHVRPTHWMPLPAAPSAEGE